MFFFCSRRPFWRLCLGRRWGVGTDFSLSERFVVLALFFQIRKRFCSLLDTTIMTQRTQFSWVLKNHDGVGDISLPGDMSSVKFIVLAFVTMVLFLSHLQSFIHCHAFVLSIAAKFFFFRSFLLCLCVCACFGGSVHSKNGLSGTLYFLASRLVNKHLAWRDDCYSH